MTLRSLLRTGTAAALAAAATLVAVGAPALAVVPDHANGLRVAHPLFWDGVEVEAAAAEGEDSFAAGWSYAVTVREEAPALRVSLDLVVDGFREWADDRTLGALGSRFVLEIERDDDPTRSASARMTAGYSVEAVVRDVVPGSYTVRARPVDRADYEAARVRHDRGTSSTRMRFRAGLESSRGAPPPEGELLPNLRILPPFELGFPVSTKTYGPGVAVAPGRAPSCMAEEYEEQAWHSAADAAANGDHEPEVGTRCLRFSAGLENTGDGPLVVHQPDWPDDADSPGWWTPEHKGDFPAYQRVLTVTDGRAEYRDRELGSAGRTRWHATHGHFHYENAYGYTLFSGTGSRSQPVEQIGRAQKRGFNPGDEKLVDWERFDQCPTLAGTTAGRTAQCSYTWFDAIAVLGKGWADIYEWNRSGQYALFPADAAGRALPGHYVLVGTADPDGVIDETDETDNTSYAWFEVTADDVVLLERGYGEGPHDPRRRVVTTAP